MAKQFRYPGVRPFSRTQANIFFGREKDQEELLQLIELDKLTVLYSKSGLGKSSLLNAALIPKVEAAGELSPYPFRFGAFYKDKEETPLGIVTDSLAQLAGNAPSFLDQIATPDMNPIWFYLKKLQLQQPDKSGFLLVFDQFEELFTYPVDLVRNFGRRIAAALYQDIPQGVLNNFEKKYKENPQFLSDEEMNLLHPPFELKVLMAIRSDRLSLLDDLTPYLPKILGRLYKLDALSAEAAEEAILNPAYQNDPSFQSPRFDYSDEALDYMLEYLTKGHQETIESFQLQILCQYIESELVVEKGLKEIKKEDIGDLDTIYRSYYERQINRLPNEADIASARKLIEEGLIEEKDQRRLSLHESQIEQFYGIKKELLDQLVETRLLRPEPHYKGGYLYELSHDSIVAPILQSKRERVELENKKEEEETRRKAEIRLKRMQEETEKNQQRMRTAKRANIFATLTLILAATTSFYFMQDYLGKRNSKLDVQEANYRDSLNLLNARSTELTSLALVEMKVDRTLAFHLAQDAVDKNPGNQLAVKVRNDILRESTLYPFYKNTLTAHKGYIADFAISKDNKWLVSASLDSTLIIWDLNDFTPVDTLLGHKGQVVDVDFSPDGKTILSADDSGLALLWPFQNGKVRKNQIDSINYGAQIYDVAFASNPNYILIGGKYLGDPPGNQGAERFLSVWSLYNHDWRNRHVPLHKGGITNVVPTERDGIAISSGPDRSIKIFDYLSKAVLYTISGLQANVSNMDYSSKSGILVAGLENGNVMVWGNIKRNAPTLINSFKAHEDNISDVILMPDEERILTSSWDKTAKLWDLNGNLLKIFLGHKDGLRAITMSEQLQMVITGGEDKTMKLWPLTAYEHQSLELNKAGGIDTTVSSVAFVGDKMLVGKYDGIALLYSKEGKYLREFNHQGMILDVALSPDGNYAATAGLGFQTIRVWKLKEPNAGPIVLSGKPPATYGIAFSPDSKQLLAGLRDNTAVLWDIAENKKIQTFEGHTSTVLKVAFSPKGDKILTASSDGTARLWSINGALITTLRHHTDRVTSVAFHPSIENVFLTSSWDNTFALWNLDTLKQEFLGHTSDVNKVAFSPDGKMILSASSDQSVRLWTLSGKELESFIWHDDSVLDAAFSPNEEDGWLILTGSKDKTAKVWKQSDLKEKILPKIAPLTEEQKKKYGM
ncbi:MAG: hypothetical protein IPL49_19395 [Saprospirales bacterium]|nr:hypothetical protein [Saprospirales bacterium]